MALTGLSGTTSIPLHDERIATNQSGAPARAGSRLTHLQPRSRRPARHRSRRCCRDQSGDLRLQPADAPARAGLDSGLAWAARWCGDAAAETCGAPICAAPGEPSAPGGVMAESLAANRPDRWAGGASWCGCRAAGSGDLRPAARQPRLSSDPRSFQLPAGPRRTRRWPRTRRLRLRSTPTRVA